MGRVVKPVDKMGDEWPRSRYRETFYKKASKAPNEVLKGCPGFSHYYARVPDAYHITRYPSFSCDAGFRHARDDSRLYAGNSLNWRLDCCRAHHTLRLSARATSGE